MKFSDVSAVQPLIGTAFLRDIDLCGTDKLVIYTQDDGVFYRADKEGRQGQRRQAQVDGTQSGERVTKAPGPQQVALLCGRPVYYSVDPTRSGNTGFLGVWTGDWNNPGRLCGGLIVESIDTNGAAEVTYVYGPTEPGSKLPWKEQHRAGVLSSGELSFQDDQGSIYSFYRTQSNILDASFISRSGKLKASFQRLR